MAYTYLTPYRRGGGSLLDLHKQMNQMFDDLLGPNTRGGDKDKKSGVTAWPSLEIDQNDKQITISAELAGMGEDDVEISMDDGMLTLTGEKKRRTKSDKGYTEFSYGRFERQVSIPSTVDLEAAQAEFDNGLLTITLPKMEEQAKGRKIEIKNASGKSERNRSEEGLIEQDRENADDQEKQDAQKAKDKNKQDA